MSDLVDLPELPPTQLGNYPLHDVIRPNYTFPGLAPFVDAAGASLEVSHEMTARAKIGWHASAIQSALSALPGLAEQIRKGHARADSLGGALKRVRDVRDSAAAQLAGMDAAIRETYEAIGVPVPKHIKPLKRG